MPTGTKKGKAKPKPKPKYVPIPSIPEPLFPDLPVIKAEVECTIEPITEEMIKTISKSFIPSFAQLTLKQVNSKCVAGNSYLKGLVCSVCGHPGGYHGPASGRCYWPYGLKGNADCNCTCKDSALMVKPDVYRIAMPPPAPPVPPPPKIPVTQKVKGLEVIKHYTQVSFLEFIPSNYFKHLSYTWHSAQYVLDRLEADPYYKPVGFSVDNNLGCFIRGCPVKPRHGFVDSKICNSKAELKDLLKKILNEDPQAEFLIMPFIDAKLSGVWTPGVFAIGPGHDGATSGKDSFEIPIDSSCFLDDSLLAQAGIEHAPYMELIWKNNAGEDFQPLFTQLRDGPKVDNGSPDFIPYSTTVTRVLQKGGDLLAWEREIKKIAKSGEQGVVVWNPGGSKVDHYSVHAMESNIPVMITREPVLGEILQKADVVYTPDAGRVRRGFEWALMYGIGEDNLANVQYNLAPATAFMLASCHLSQVWKGREDFLLGAGMGFGYKLGLLALAGELRHLDLDGTSKPTRQSVYYEAWTKLSKLINVQNDLHLFWHKKWINYKCGKTMPFEDYVSKYTSNPLGMGGPKWGECGIIVQSLGQAMLAENDVSKAILTMNKIINLAHNGGWMYNKFLKQNYFDSAGHFPIAPLSAAAPLVYEAKLAEKAGWECGKKCFEFIPFHVPDEEASTNNGIKVIIKNDVDTLRAAWKAIGQNCKDSVENGLNHGQDLSLMNGTHKTGCQVCRCTQDIKGWSIAHEKCGEGIPAPDQELDAMMLAHLPQIKKVVCYNISMGGVVCCKCKPCNESEYWLCENIKWDFKNKQVWWG